MQQKLIWWEFKQNHPTFTQTLREVIDKGLIIQTVIPLDYVVNGGMVSTMSKALIIANFKV